MKFINLLVLVFFSLSCHKNIGLSPDCDCDGKTYTEIIDASAAYTGHYDFFIKSENMSGSTTALVSLCQPIDTTSLVKSGGVYNYKLSGKLKGVCLPEGVHPILPLYVLSLDSLNIGRIVIKQK